MVHIWLRWGTMVWSAGKRKKEDHGKNHLPHTQGEEISTKSIRLNFYLQNSWRKVIKYGKYPDDEGVTVQSPLFILKYHFSWFCIHFKTEHSKQRRLRIFTQLMPTKCLNVSLFCEMLKKNLPQVLGYKSVQQTFNRASWTMKWVVLRKYMHFTL